MPSHRPPTEAAAPPLITRRSAIVLVGAAGAAGTMLVSLACAPSSPSASAPGSPSGSASGSGRAHDLDLAQWQELQGELFHLKGSPHSEERPAQAAQATLVLKEVDERTVENDEHRPDDLRDTTLSLLFIAPDGLDLPNATYTLEHPDLGRFALFLHEMPRDEHPHELIYEAVLN